MKIKSIDKNLHFLQGEGEMAKLIREKNWEKTDLGNPGNWPQHLRVTLSIMLNSKFPMFLFWGPELTCFYNDAYRPSLGQQGKHPAILGSRGADSWKEIWHIIKPLIDQVLLKNEAIWLEDQLLPIFRNGKIEEVYWTFSYSPIIDDSGKAQAVFVTCIETSASIVTQKKLQESESRLRLIISQAHLSIAIFSGKDYVTEIANSRALELLGRQEKEILKHPLFNAVPELLSQGIDKLFDAVYQTGKRFHNSELAIELIRNGTLETAYVNFSLDPLYNADGIIDGIIATAFEITEQVQAHKKIKASEEKLNIVIEGSELGTWEVNFLTNEIRYSDRYLEILGHKKGLKISHQEIIKQIHPDDLSLRMKALQEAKENGILYFICRIIWNDQSIHWIEAKGKVFFNESKEPWYMLGTIRDTTEDIKTQKILEEREKRFRILADTMPIHVWIADAEGNLNYFNKTVHEYSGLKTEDLIKKGWLQMVHPDDQQENIKVWTEAINSGNDFLMEHRFRMYTGVFRWQLSRAIPVKDENGKIIMWVGTSTDIHEQKAFANELENQVAKRTEQLKQLNETLKKSEQQYHLMVGEVQDYAILYLNNDGIIENWNAGAEKIKGYKPKEIIGKSFLVFYTEEDRKKNLPNSLLKAAAQSGRIVNEGWRVRKDKSLFWASVVITAIHNNNQELIGFSKVTHDLTERKKAQDQLQKKSFELEQRNKELNKMVKELESFNYISSHDLQEPLRKIRSFSNLILQREQQSLSDNAKNYFERMQDAALRMQNLINDLLAYSRTNTNDRIFEIKNLDAIVEEIKMDLNEELQQKNAIIETNVNCEVSVIPFQIKQLLTNLISNSLKFTKPDIAPIIKIQSKIDTGVNFKIEKLIQKNKYCHIQYSDNGIGFDQEYSERIFGLFQRLHDKSNYAGTGIGLSIVKKIVENHNGLIIANSTLGNGATFEIYLPLHS